MSNEIKLVKQNKWWRLWVNPKDYKPGEPLTFADGFNIKAEMDVDNDTIKSNPDGDAMVADQSFSIAENSTKYTSGALLTFKGFWQSALNKINGLITRIGAADRAISANAGAIAKEISDRASAVSTVAAGLDAEVSTRKTETANLAATKADKTELTTAIEQEQEDRHAEVVAAVAQETSDRMAAVTQVSVGLEDTKDALNETNANVDVIGATLDSTNEQLFGDSGLQEKIDRIDAPADMPDSFRAGDAATLAAAKEYSDQKTAESEARDMVGYFALGRTDGATAFPDANDDAKAFDFSTNTPYLRVSGAWQAQAPMSIGTNAEIEVVHMLDGLDIAAKSMVGKKADGLWNGSAWEFVSVGYSGEADIDFDEDTLKARASDGKYEVASQQFTATDDITKFGNGSLTFKGFWQVTINKINGLISFMNRAAGFATSAQGAKADAAATQSDLTAFRDRGAGFATAAQGAKADSAVQPDAISDMATNAGVDAKLTKKADVTALSAHTDNSSNPHGTTKAQVGLGNVENITPANMPVSDAVAEALNGKVDRSQINSANGVAGLDENSVLPTSLLDPDFVANALAGGGNEDWGSINDPVD